MNSIELLEAHGKLTEALVDLDALEPLPGEANPTKLAAEIIARAAHLAIVMEAVDFYVESIVLDMANAAFPDPAYSPPLIKRRKGSTELLAAIEAYARRVDPNITQPTPRPRRGTLDAAMAQLAPETAGLIDSLKRLEELTTPPRAIPKFISRR